MTPKADAVSRRAVLAAALAAAAFPGAIAIASANERRTDMQIRMMFDGRTMTATLHDNPSARDFFSLLPLDLAIEDFGSNEKIAYLPRKLTEEGSGPFGDERPYDLCYYVPWGNLAMFYDSYKPPGLIRLGRFDAGQDALHVRGKFPLRIERAG